MNCRRRNLLCYLGGAWERVAKRNGISKRFESLQMNEILNPDVREKFATYPDVARPTMLRLRQLVFETASETEGVGEVEETLKWGEPSYLTTNGSTLRMDWKPRSPAHCAMYFHCQSKLIDTFKSIYGDLFRFEGDRGILLGLDEEIPQQELKHCISLCLRYHQIKHLPLLGV